jgi:hypothetical protein
LEDYKIPKYYPMIGPSDFLPNPKLHSISYRGTVRMAFKYKEDEAQLECVAVSGTNLAQMARWPFVKIHVFPGVRGKQKSPTQNKPSPQNPEFNHLFTFNSMKRSYMKESGLHIG